MQVHMVQVSGLGLGLGLRVECHTCSDVQMHIVWMHRSTEAQKHRCTDASIWTATIAYALLRYTYTCTVHTCARLNRPPKVPFS